jgi:hypothetical protein
MNGRSPLPLAAQRISSKVAIGFAIANGIGHDVKRIPNSSPMPSNKSLMVVLWPPKMYRCPFRRGQMTFRHIVRVDDIGFALHVKGQQSVGQGDDDETRSGLDVQFTHNASWTRDNDIEVPSFERHSFDSFFRGKVDTVASVRGHLVGFIRQNTTLAWRSDGGHRTGYHQSIDAGTTSRFDDMTSGSLSQGHLFIDVQRVPRIKPRTMKDHLPTFHGLGQAVDIIKVGNDELGSELAGKKRVGASATRGDDIVTTAG